MTTEAVPRSPEHEHDYDPRLDISIKGMEKIIMQSLCEFKQSTFENYWEYLLVCLEMPVENEKYDHISDFEGKVMLILKNWVDMYGEEATINKFNTHLRNHRNITGKIRTAVLNLIEV